MFNFKRVFSLFFILCSTFSYAETPPQVLEITHTKFDKPLQFNVTLPAGYAKNTDKSYVMMFDFHPNAITYLRGMHDWMSHNGEWPWLETIIITPAAGNRLGMLFDGSGKTTPLLDFFDQQLFTKVDEKYRTNGFRIMSGFRVNATVVLSALLNKPNMIDAYIATSPELANDYVKIISTAKHKLTTLTDKPRYLLFSHGTNVKEDHQMHAYSELRQALSASAPNQLSWHYKHFADNYFMSLPILATTLGIENIFADIHQGLAPDSVISKRGVAAIIKHYDYLTKEKYGFPVSPKESIERLGLYLLTSQPDKGIAVLKKNIKLFPNNAYTHHALAKAYATLNDFSLAIKHQQDAVTLSVSMLTWHRKRLQKFLTTYQEALAQSSSLGN